MRYDFASGITNRSVGLRLGNMTCLVQDMWRKTSGRERERERERKRERERERERERPRGRTSDVDH